jgi:hypothetical protein
LMGQVSGIIFIFGMDAMKDKSTGSMSTPLLTLAALVVFAAVLALVLHESPVHRDQTAPAKSGTEKG